MTPRISLVQRRARLAWRHRLVPAARADDPVDVARDLVALHATDPASVHLSAAARMTAPTVPDIERALYDDRTLLRILGMRRTVFVVPRDTAPVVQAACSDAVAAVNRRRLSQLLVDAGITDDPAAWLAEATVATLAALADLKEATGVELAAKVPALRTRVGLAEGKSYGATVNLTSQVLFQISAEGHIVRGRPKGTWISSQHRWSLAADWLPGPPPVWEGPAARTELARQWLRAFGPAPVADLRWWAGWTAGDTKKALAGLDVVEVEIDGGATLGTSARGSGAAMVLADDLDPVPDPGPWVALLPALDPTVMGWLERGWFLGPHAGTLFDRTGNAGPTVWVDGRVVGGWGQGPDGTVRYRLLEPVSAKATRQIDKAAATLTGWLGPVRVTPRFRTPLEKELAAG